MKTVIGIDFYISIGLFVLVLVLGLILHRTGKPYDVALFNAHKFVSLTLVVFSSIVIFSFAKQTDLTFNLYLFISLLVLSVVALFASGALLYLDRMNKLMLIIHWIATGSFAMSLVFLLYRVFQVKN